MNWIWWLIIGIILLIVMIPFLKINVNLNYLHDKDNDDLKLKVSTLFGLISFRFEVPVIAVDDDSPSIVVKEEQHSSLSDSEKTDKFTAKEILRGIEKAKDFLEHIVGFHKIVSRFLSHVIIHHFKWHSVLGIGDAAHTAILAGVAWSIKGTVLGIISNYMKLKTKPNIIVEPLFQQISSHTELSCMFSFRIGHAILAALQVVKHRRKRPIATKTDLYEQNGINS